MNTTLHEVKRMKERLGINAKAAVRMTGLAYERGRGAEAFSGERRRYLESKAKNNSFALVYQGNCFIFADDENRNCKTVFQVPDWFMKKTMYSGKEKVRNVKVFGRHYPETYDDDSDKAA